MLFFELIKMAIRSLVANKLRTFLTTLGMVIGVAAVISMISIGEGAKKSTLGTIAKFGTNIISIKPGEKKSRQLRRFGAEIDCHYTNRKHKGSVFPELAF